MWVLETKLRLSILAACTFTCWTILLVLYLILWDRVFLSLSLNLKLTEWLACLARKSQTYSSLSISSTGITGTHSHVWLFRWLLGIWTQVFRLAQPTLYWVMFPAVIVSFSISCSTRNQTQGLMHFKQAFYHWVTSLDHSFFWWSMCFQACLTPYHSHSWMEMVIPH